MSSAQNLAESKWGFSLQTGGSIGTVSVPVKSDDNDSGSESDGETELKKVTVGGFPLILNATTDYTHNVGLAFGGSLLFDLPNSQISQLTFRSTLFWHLFGGAKNLIQGDPERGSYYMVSNTPSQFSLAVQGALVSYSASSEDLSVSVNGSSFEVRTGFRYRYDVGLFSAGGIQVLGTLFNMPADQERIDSKTVEISFFWQV